jgi:hypothetical protein
VTSHQFILLQENQQQRKINQATTIGTTLKVGTFKDKKRLNSEKTLGNMILISVVKTGRSVSSRAMNEVLPNNMNILLNPERPARNSRNASRSLQSCLYIPCPLITTAITTTSCSQPPLVHSLNVDNLMYLKTN